jgi:ferredoxin
MQIILQGRAEPVPAQAGETILTSLLRAGVQFPFSCQTGTCGTCKCELLSGKVVELAHSEQALSTMERAEGIVLACRAQLCADAVVRRLDTEGTP